MIAMPWGWRERWRRLREERREEKEREGKVRIKEGKKVRESSSFWISKVPFLSEPVVLRKPHKGTGGRLEGAACPAVGCPDTCGPAPSGGGWGRWLRERCGAAGPGRVREES